MEKTVRIGCAVPMVSVADPKTNCPRICDLIRQAGEDNCELLVFPELCVTGYTCGDLFRQKLLVTAAAEAVKTITAVSSHYPRMDIVIGAPMEIEGHLFDCGVVMKNGKVRGVVPKVELTPAERRWFSDTPVIDPIDTIPVHADLQLDLSGGASFCIRFDNTTAHTQIVAQLTARPALADMDYCNAVRGYSASNGCVCASVSAGPSESGQDMVYSGHCLVAANGTLLAERCLEDGYLLTVDTDLSCLEKDAVFPENRQRPTLSTEPFYGGDDRCREIFQIQVLGLANRLRQLRCKPVIGVSGGLDSTLALLVAVEAVRKNGRPASDVCAVTMPGFGTSGRTYDNAKTLMELLGVSVKEVSICPAVEQHFRDIGHDISVHNATYENAQARERTQILMDYASVVGGIVVGTGDLSELALGWCTYNGDHMSMYSVNASVPKTLIPHIIRTVTQFPQYQQAAAVLEDIIATPISPELLPTDDQGNLTQQTEDLVGPYLLHDFFLYHTLRYGRTPREIFELASRAFAGQFAKTIIKKWLGVFYRRFFSQQFKRSCLPEGVKVGSISLGPRGDWCMPSDASAKLWLNEVDRL